MSEDETPSTAEEMRALAELAEAEAAEAEALANAARARARAIRLRHQAELAQPAAAVPRQRAATTAEGNAHDLTHGEAPELEAEAEPLDSESAVATESVEIEQSLDVDVEGSEANVPADSNAANAAPTSRWRRLRARRSTIAYVLAVIVILAALTSSVYMVIEHRTATRQRERAAEFAAAARQGVVTLTSLDFNNAKQGMQRILDDSTGSFRDDLLKTADDFIKVVEQAQVVEQGTVQAVAVDLDTMTDDSAVVLVSSTSEVTNAAGAKKDPRKYRLIVTITRDGDQLKMSKVEFVP